MHPLPVHPASIIQPAPSDQSALPRHLRRALVRLLDDLTPAVHASAAACQAERYRKHFDCRAQLALLLITSLSASPSLRRGYLASHTCPGLLDLVGVRDPASPPDAPRLRVSFSQFAASNTSRPAAFLSGLLPTLIATVRKRAAHAPGLPPSSLHVVDSTFVHLSLRLADWLPPRSDPKRSGIQVLVQYQPAHDLPEHLVYSDTRTNDVQRLDAAILDDPVHLASLAGQTLVLDLGFYSHARFARLRAAGVSVISRLHPQAHLRVLAERPVQTAFAELESAMLTIVREAAVSLGSPNNRAGAVLRGMRLIEAVVQPHPRAAKRGAQPVTYRLVTDRWDLTALEVVQCYCWRWSIELFFRWLKRVLRALRWLGYSPNAIELSVVLAIVVHLLCVLLAQAVGLGRHSVALVTLLPGTLAHLGAADRQPPPPEWQQLPLLSQPP